MPTAGRIFIVIGALGLMLANQLGAYGIHGLEAKVSAAEMRSWEWAVQIQYYHSAGLILIALLLKPARQSRLLAIAGGLMILGQLLFSGSIYARVLGAPALIGQVAPMGGGSLMLAWLLTAIAGFRMRPTSSL